MSADVPAVEKSIRILERLAAECPRPVSPATLIADLALNRSTCYSILATLRAQGWGVSPGRAGWTIGPRLLTLAGVCRELAGGVVREELDELSRRLGAVTVAVVPDGGGQYLVVAKGECTQGVRVSIGIGDRLPGSARAVRQVFAAWGTRDEAARRGFPSKGAEAADVLGRVRSQAYGRSAGPADFPEGIAAAAVFDVDGRGRMALTVLAMPEQKADEEVDRIGRALRDSAMLISARTGGLVPEP